MLGLSIKDVVIGGIATTSLVGSAVNMISNHRLKKRMNNTEQVLQQLGAMPAPTAPQTQPAAQPQQPQAQPPVTGQAPQAPQQ